MVEDLEELRETMRAVMASWKERAALRGRAEMPRGTGPAHDAKKIVLVIDDDRDVREAFCEVLDAEGYEALGAADGTIGMKLLREHVDEICLVILDLMMPGMNGWEFRREQRADPVIADVPVVIVSASPTNVEELHAPVLKKPVTIDSVLAHVQPLC